LPRWNVTVFNAAVVHPTDRIPAYWMIYPILHQENLKDSSANLLDQFDFTKVKIEAG